MNLLLLDPDELDVLAHPSPGETSSPMGIDRSGSVAQAVLRDKRRVEHVRNILRLKVGDSLRVGVLGAGLWDGTVLDLDDGCVTVSLFESNRALPPPLPIRLALALPRPPTLQRCLHAAVTMGVKHITLFHSSRVEKSYWTSHALRESELEQTVRLALEQCGDTLPPVIEIQRSFTRFVRDELGGREVGSSLWFAHPGAHHSAITRRHTQDVLFVGPEGGFVDWELGLLREAGAEQLALGPRPLRVEVACTALLARYGAV